MNLIYLGQYSNGYNMMDGSFGWSMLMMLFWVTIIVLIVVLVIRGIGSAGANPGTKDEGALEIAKKRYAKGEITKIEFEQIKKDIK